MSEQKMLASEAPEKVSGIKLVAWQTRPISVGAISIIFGYLSLYCTDTLGMPAALVGTLLMASKLFDGVTDLIAGWVVDNTHTRWGKARPYEICVIGVWVCTYALFSASAEWSMVAKGAWIFIMYTLIWSIFYTLLNAAETPYIIRAFGNKTAITKVSAYGGLIVTFGCMIVSITFPMAVAQMGTSTAGWQKMMLMYAVPLVIMGMLRFFIVKEEYVSENETEEKVSVKDIFELLKTNKYVWIFGLTTFVPQLIMGMSVASYYYERVVGDLSLYSIIQLSGMIAMLYMLIFPAMMKKYTAMQIIGITAVIGMVGYIILFFAGVNMPLLVAGSVLSGVASLPTSYMRSVVIMQIADYNVAHGKAALEATMSSAVNFMTKIGNALGAFLLGIFLEMGGYNGALDVQPDSALFTIRVLYSLVPAAFMIIMILTAVWFKPLDKWTKEHAQEIGNK